MLRLLTLWAGTVILLIGFINSVFIMQLKQYVNEKSRLIINKQKTVMPLNGTRQ